MDDPIEEFRKWHQEQMEVAAIEAAHMDVNRPLVVGLDLEDKNGHMLACKFASDDDVNQRVADCRSKGTDASLITVLSQDQAIEWFGRLTPRAMAFLTEDVPDGLFRFLIIAGGHVRFGLATRPE